jgi:hypothetical protein
MSEALIGPQRAVIAAVDDPEERGRYRVRVFAIHDDAIPVENLPWAELLCHAGNDWGNVPHYEVDDLIFVLFEGGDREHPVIMGGWLTAPGGASTLPSEQTEAYSTDRRRWVWKDRAGNLVEVSEKNGEKHVKLKSGEAEVIVSQEDNSFAVTASGPASITVEGAATVQAGGAVLVKSTGGKVTVDASGDAEVKAGGKVKLGSASFSGCVRKGDACAFTGFDHPFASETVEAQG